MEKTIKIPSELRKGQYIYNLVEFINRETDNQDIFYVSDETFDKLTDLYCNKILACKKSDSMI